MSGSLEVIEPGLLTTVQDLGRADAVEWGVPVGGACDSWSLRVANALAGNRVDAAALEITLAGPTLRALEDSYVGLAGADLQAVVSDTGARVHPGRGLRLRRGQSIAFGAVEGGSGIRAYLAVAGGIDVPEVLGSASTCLVGGFGGLDGRRLEAGDVVTSAGGSYGWPGHRRWIDGRDPALEATQRALRVLPGPNLDRLPPDAFERLVEGAYRVSGRGDRQAIVLEGAALADATEDATMLSQGVANGAIQVPPDGRPICLLADHQTVGGYPVVAVVISADLPLLGQLGPGDPVRFSPVGRDEAARALHRQEEAWRAGLARLAAER